MFPILPWILGPVLAALSVQAQYAAKWTDSISKTPFTRYYFEILDTSYGYIFPSAQAASDEFIGIFIAPISSGWVGTSLGSGMQQNLLVAGWVDGSRPVLSTRYTTSYAPPTPYAGPKVTLLGSSGTNKTHQRIVYRCQNCTTWKGGSIPLSASDGIFGYATQGSLKPDTPSDPNSGLSQHTAAGAFGIDIANARTDQYSTYLAQLVAAPPLGGTPTTSPTTPPPVSTIPVPTGALNCPSAPRPSYSMVAGTGFQVVPVLGRLTQPRGIAVDTVGNLLVVQRGMGISGHALDANGCVSSTKTIVSDTGLNHGIDVVADKLFASSADAAFVWDYNPTTMTATNKKTLVTGMNHADHITRTLWLSRKYPNLLIVSSGSDANIDLASFTPATGRAIVKIFEWKTLPSNGVNYASGGKTFGYGLRNDVGIVEDRAGIIHSVENSCDDAYRTVNGQRTDVHTDNPAEKIYNLGNPNAPANPYFGGYPYCFTVWEPSSFRDKTFTPGDWFVQAPNTTLTDAWCNTNAKKPTAILPPHTAPLDGKLGVGTDSYMYVSLHGSWNRQPPTGYKVVAVNGQYSSAGEWSPSASFGSKTGFIDVIKNQDESRCTTGCFRPVGLAWASNGYNLYVSSDTSGEVFLVRKSSGSGVTTSVGPGPGPTSVPTSAPTSPTTVPTSAPTSPTTVPTSAPTSPTTVRPTTTTPSTTSSAPQPTQTVYGQCGGRDWKGPTQCASGSTCKFSNDYYSQCLP